MQEGNLTMVMHWTLSLATAMWSASLPLCPRNLRLRFTLSLSHSLSHPRSLTLSPTLSLSLSLSLSHGLGSRA